MIDRATHLLPQATREGHATLIGEDAHVQASVILHAEATQQIVAPAEQIVALDFDVLGETLRDVLGGVETASPATRAVVALPAIGSSGHFARIPTARAKAA